MAHLKKTLLFLSALSLLTNFSAQAQAYGKNGMVVSSHTLASKVGIDILKKEGNAVDAAIATAFALAVTHPSAGNIGGGGFMVYRPSTGDPTTIDFREKAPLAASADMFLDDAGKLVPNSNHRGTLSIGVPGTVAGLYLAHQKYGSLPWADLVQPSIDLAEKGFPLSFALGQTAVYYSENHAGEFMGQFFSHPDGSRVKMGEVWKQPKLAETLTFIRDQGQDGFYRGKVADEIVHFMNENGGIITKEDLIQYRAIERAPVVGTYHDYEIISMPPPSSGGVALIEMLNMMECADFDSIEFNSSEYVHLTAEVMRRAYADRAEFIGDPDFNEDMPVDILISKDLAKKRFATIDWNKASVSDSTRFNQLPEGENTTHFSVIDKNGNAVSVTYTLEYSYGAEMGSTELGFIFNNEMGDFNPQPGYTNSGWLIGTAPNVIAPGKRMLSSMSPTIIAKDDQPFLVIGSPGGRTIINTVFQSIFNVLEYEMPLEQAIEAMKIHHQWMPDRIVYEKHLLSPDTRDELQNMGHEMRSIRALGQIMGIQVHSPLGVYYGVSDSSSPDGGAVGY